MLMDRQIPFLKSYILPKLAYKYNAIPNKILTTLVCVCVCV